MPLGDKTFPRRLIESLESRIAPAFAAHFDLGGLNGGNGFHLSGVAPIDYAGASVSDAGMLTAMVLPM
jgi:hypothetical protein